MAKCVFCATDMHFGKVLDIPCFYRNETKKEYFFCSDDCLEKFRIKNCCYICNYDCNLLDAISRDGFMIKLCNLYPGNYSCYQKYLQVPEQDFFLTECVSCLKKSENNIYSFGQYRCKLCSNKKNLFDAISKETSNCDYEAETDTISNSSLVSFMHKESEYLL